MITSGTVDPKRHEPMSYETGNSALKFTQANMKGPIKSIQTQKKLSVLFSKTSDVYNCRLFIELFIDSDQWTYSLQKYIPSSISIHVTPLPVFPV